MIAALMASVLAATPVAWIVKNGVDGQSRRPYSIAMLPSDKAMLAFECQDDRDIMVGITIHPDLMPGKPAAQKATFRAGNAAPISIDMAVEPSKVGPIFIARLSENQQASKLATYLMAQKGELTASIAGQTFTFPDDGREDAFIATLKACGIALAKPK